MLVVIKKGRLVAEGSLESLARTIGDGGFTCTVIAPAHNLPPTLAADYPGVTVAANGGRVVISGPSQIDTDRLISELIRGGATIDGFERSRGSLEEIFLVSEVGS